MQLLVPAITTEVTISKRGSKLFINPSQNDVADTVAAPYSVRPYHQPSVSTPLDWKEIYDKPDPLQFTISTILKMIEQKGDLYEKVLDKKLQQRMRKCYDSSYKISVSVCTIITHSTATS